MPSPTTCEWDVCITPVSDFRLSSWIHSAQTPDPGQLATAGNFAIPLTPHEQEAGPVFRFSLYHLIPSPDPADWPIKLLQAGVTGGTAAKDTSFAPKVKQVVAKPPKAVLNGHAAKLTSTSSHGGFDDNETLSS